MDQRKLMDNANTITDMAKVKNYINFNENIQRKLSTTFLIALDNLQGITLIYVLIAIADTKYRLRNCLRYEHKTRHFRGSSHHDGRQNRSTTRTARTTS